MLDKDAVAIIRTQFPKYDKHLHSKVKRPDDYGIRLLRSAERLIADTTRQEPRRADKRRFPCRVQCRIPKRQKTRLQQAFRRDGHDTIQDGMACLIKNYLGGKS